MDTPIKIIIADDHYVVRMGLVAILKLQPDMIVLGEAEDGSGALELYRQHRPDVTLMDLRMPGMNGVEATLAICQEFPQAKILILTTYDREEDIYRALQAGARGYMSKRVLGQQLVEAIKTVHAGGKYIPGEVARRLAEHVPGCDLTARELEVLRLLSKGLNNKEIGNLMGFTRFTAKFHVQNILQKLGASDRTEAVAAAVQRGILNLD